MAKVTKKKSKSIKSEVKETLENNTLSEDLILVPPVDDDTYQSATIKSKVDVGVDDSVVNTTTDESVLDGMSYDEVYDVVLSELNSIIEELDNTLCFITEKGRVDKRNIAVYKHVNRLLSIVRSIGEDIYDVRV